MKQVFAVPYGQADDGRGRFKYCPFCGTELTLKEVGGRQRPACPNCGFVQFRNPLPGVVVLIEREGSVLLGKRRGGFGAGAWGLPQGYVEFDEDFLTAAIHQKRYRMVDPLVQIRLSEFIQE